MQLQQLNTYSNTLCFGLLIPLGPISSKMVFIKMERSHAPSLELVSKELNHFGVIADLFRQIGGHSTGCASHFENPTNFKILKEPLLVQKQTLHSRTMSGL